MGCSYSVQGRIPLKCSSERGVRAIDAALAAMEEELGRMFGAGLVHPTSGGTYLEVNIGDSMSYGSAGRVDEVLKDFAEAYASAGAVLATECDGSRDILVVGANELACMDAEIAYVEAEAAELGKTLTSLRLARARFTGGDLDGN